MFLRRRLLALLALAAGSGLLGSAAVGIASADPMLAAAAGNPAPMPAPHVDGHDHHRPGPF